MYALAVPQGLHVTGSRQACADHRTDLHLGHVQLAAVLGRVVDFQLLGDAPRLGRPRNPHFLHLLPMGLVRAHQHLIVLVV